MVITIIIMVITHSITSYLSAHIFTKFRASTRLLLPEVLGSLRNQPSKPRHAGHAQGK